MRLVHTNSHQQIHHNNQLAVSRALLRRA
jgi:hypothetical protein